MSEQSKMVFSTLADEARLRPRMAIVACCSALPQSVSSAAPEHAFHVYTSAIMALRKSALHASFQTLAVVLVSRSRAFSLSLSICLKTSAWVLRSGMASPISFSGVRYTGTPNLLSFIGE